MQPRSILSAILAVTLLGFLSSGPSLAAKKTALTHSGNIADAGGPYAGAVGEVIQFDGSATAVESGKTVTYHWSFGDESYGQGVNPTHAYRSGGEHIVTLTVYYDGAPAGVAQTAATIAGNERPVAVLYKTYKAAAGEPIEFDGSRSYDPDGRIASYAWDFGDGTRGEGVRPVHAYAKSKQGSYVVTLTVTDDTGLTSGLAGTSVKVRDGGNRAPVAEIGLQLAHAGVGAPVQFDASGSFDSDGAVDSYDWDFGDGNVGSGASATHRYVAAGSYDVKLTVTDNAGASGGDVAAATVYDNAQPTLIRFRAPARVKVSGAPVTDTLSVVAAVYGGDKNQQLCGLAHLETDTGARYQAPVCFSGDGKHSSVNFEHVFGLDSTETVTWNAWVELDNGQVSNRLSKYSQVVFR